MSMNVPTPQKCKYYIDSGAFHMMPYIGFPVLGYNYYALYHVSSSKPMQNTKINLSIPDSITQLISRYEEVYLLLLIEFVLTFIIVAK